MVKEKFLLEKEHNNKFYSYGIDVNSKTIV